MSEESSRVRQPEDWEGDRLPAPFSSSEPESQEESTEPWADGRRGSDVGPVGHQDSIEEIRREEIERQRGPSGIRPLLIEILQTVLLTLIIFIGVRSVVQNFKVDGASMEPTLHSGQYLLVNKAAYFHVEGAPLRIAERLGLFRDATGSVFPFGGPQRGDIVVFIPPGSDDRDFIKRVIGLPGDVVQVDRGHVYVNGVLQDEEYIRALPTYSLPPQKVPDGKYFVLGDNRPNSSDSHIWGLVPEANLIGKAWLSYWPPNEWGVLANRGIASN